MARRIITTLITDLDNTLWDWVGIWHASFSAMFDELVRNSGVPRDQLEAEIRAVHQRHGTSEYAFVIEELPSLRALHPGRDLSAVYGGAIEAYRESRRRTLQFYPGVEDTLRAIRSSGTRIVAYTESMSFYSRFRVKSTSLDLLLDGLYAPEDHDIGSEYASVHDNPVHRESVTLRHSEHRHTPRGVYKPAPQILLQILEDVGADPATTVYVGDSVTKDVAMAQDAGVIDVLAKYGAAQHREAYEQLRRVTHWTDEMVAREKVLLQRPPVVPSHEIGAFSELLTLFEFGRAS